MENDRKQEAFELSDKVKAVVAGFTETLGVALEASRKKAFDNLTDYLTDYALEDFRANTLYAAEAIIGDVLAGKDTYRTIGWATHLFEPAKSIRDHLWKNYADQITKTALEEKDAEILRLKECLSRDRSVF